MLLVFALKIIFYAAPLDTVILNQPQKVDMKAVW